MKEGLIEDLKAQLEAERATRDELVQEYETVTTRIETLMANMVRTSGEERTVVQSSSTLDASCVLIKSKMQERDRLYLEQVEVAHRVLKISRRLAEARRDICRGHESTA